MAMRLSEVHPALVHFPLALLPISLGADTVAGMTGRRSLFATGAWTMAGAAISAAVAGVFGLIAQEEVSLDEEGSAILKTHRTLNVAALGALTAMALVRSARRRPSRSYLFAGFALLATVTYSAYLGGKLVYDHGAGVKRVGVGRPDPELTARNAGFAASQAARDLGRGVKHAAEDARHGDLVPALRPKGKLWS